MQLGQRFIQTLYQLERLSCLLYHWRETRVSQPTKPMIGALQRAVNNARQTIHHANSSSFPSLFHLQYPKTPMAPQSVAHRFLRTSFKVIGQLGKVPHDRLKLFCVNTKVQEAVSAVATAWKYILTGCDAQVLNSTILPPSGFGSL